MITLTPPIGWTTLDAKSQDMDACSAKVCATNDMEGSIESAGARAPDGSVLVVLRIRNLGDGVAASPMTLTGTTITTAVRDQYNAALGLQP